MKARTGLNIVMVCMVATLPLCIVVSTMVGGVSGYIFSATVIPSAALFLVYLGKAAKRYGTSEMIVSIMTTSSQIVFTTLMVVWVLGWGFAEWTWRSLFGSVVIYGMIWLLYSSFTQRRGRRQSAPVPWL